jgi:hypothetical protein
LSDNQKLASESTSEAERFEDPHMGRFIGDLNITRYND